MKHKNRYITLTKEDITSFLDKAKNAKAYEKDMKELLDLGYKSLYDFFKDNILFDDILFTFNHMNHPLAFIQAKRNGTLHVFFTNKIDAKKLIFVLRALKSLLHQYKNCNSFYMKIPNWYKSAQRNAKKVGFKPYKYEEFYTIWLWTKDE